MLDWWDSQKGWKVQMQLVSSELIKVDSFLEGLWHWDWSGASRVWRREGLRSAAQLSSSVYWDGMTDQISWKVLGRRIRWSAHRRMSHCCFFPDFSLLQRSGERHLVRFWRRWLHLVSSPSSSIQRWLSYGTKGNREATIPLRKRGFYQFHVSAEVLCRSTTGGRRGSSGRCFSSSTGGAWRPGWTWP